MTKIRVTFLRRNSEVHKTSPSIAGNSRFLTQLLQPVASNHSHFPRFGTKSDIFLTRCSKIINHFQHFSHSKQFICPYFNVLSLQSGPYYSLLSHAFNAYHTACKNVVGMDDVTKNMLMRKFSHNSQRSNQIWILAQCGNFDVLKLLFLNPVTILLINIMIRCVQFVINDVLSPFRGFMAPLSVKLKVADGV